MTRERALEIWRERSLPEVRQGSLADSAVQCILQATEEEAREWQQLAERDREYLRAELLEAGGMVAELKAALKLAEEALGPFVRYVEYTGEATNGDRVVLLAADDQAAVRWRHLAVARRALAKISEMGRLEVGK